MPTCPHCDDAERQAKAGFNRTRSQRYECQVCRRTYTPEPRPLGYDDATKATALKLYVEGNGFRRIARLLNVNHQSVVNWVNAAHRNMAARRAPGASETPSATLEMDELYTFVQSKKAEPTSSRSSIARRG